jgi:hypothetical protein
MFLKYSHFGLFSSRRFAFLCVPVAMTMLVVPMAVSILCSVVVLLILTPPSPFHLLKRSFFVFRPMLIRMHVLTTTLLVGVIMSVRVGRVRVIVRVIMRLFLIKTRPSTTNNK